MLPRFPFPAVVDNTIVSTYRSCPRKFWWAYQRRIAPTDESVHLVAGKALAKGLEVTRKLWADKGMPFEDALAYGGAALLAEYGTFEPTHGSDNKTALNVLGALGYYFKTWPIDKVLVPYKSATMDKHAIEFAIAVPIPGTKHPETGNEIIYSGRFDSIMAYQDTMLLGEDDKTASQLGASWLSRWRLSNQTLGYTWGTLQYGIKLSGFNVRGVGLYKNDYGNLEDLRMIPHWKVELFEDQLRDTILRMIRDWERNEWPMDLGNACAQFGGCAFLTLCDSQYPEDWIKGNYVPYSWDPLASRD